MSRTKITPWHGEPHKKTRLVLGKMSEELSECSARISRAIIHGLNEKDPDTGRTNLEEIEREISDVLATFKLANLSLNIAADEKRVEDKFNGYLDWMGMIE